MTFGKDQRAQVQICTLSYNFYILIYVFPNLNKLINVCTSLLKMVRLLFGIIVYVIISVDPGGCLGKQTVLKFLNDHTAFYSSKQTAEGHIMFFSNMYCDTS